MTQDKSREFLHSGNDKDKFKVLFFSGPLLLNSHDQQYKIIEQNPAAVNQNLFRLL